MPTVLKLVLAPEDEKQLFSFLTPFHLTAYPDRVPRGYVPIVVDADAAQKLVEPAYYLAAEELATLSMRPVKRGKDKGALAIDETGSPVLHYRRSIFDDAGELRSGRLWCELNLTGDMQRNPAFPEPFRKMLLAIREHLQTRLHRSDPPGWVVGAHAARLSKAGTILREEGRHGIVLKAYK